MPYLETEYQKKIFEKSYRQHPEETVDGMFERVSFDNEDILRLYRLKKFISGGRILANMGGTGNQMPGNCFGVPIEDSRVGIMKCQADTFEIYAYGGGVGTNFSPLRAKGSEVKGVKSNASGPCSFIDAFDHYADTIKQGSSNRRAAKMTILNVDHPDILEFITAKQDHKRWNNTNVSVGITDSFMEALYKEDSWALSQKGEIQRTLEATDIWQEMCRCAHASGEPGVLFLDTIQKGYPLRYKYEVVTTNPCGELPSPPYGMCLLGSMILSSYVCWSDDVYKGTPSFDFVSFAQDVKTAVEYLDSLIDRAVFPIPETEEMIKNTRPLGLGITGLADMLFYMKMRYGSTDSLVLVDAIMETMYSAAREASEDLAKEAGPFPDYDKELADFSPRRNSTLLAVAPTGTVSGLVWCSYGIEPMMAPTVIRHELGQDMLSNAAMHKMKYTGEIPLPEWASFVGGVVDEKYLVTLDEHLEMLKVVAKHVDSAVSKTINFPNSATVEEVSKVFKYCWENGIKGCTVYRDRCRKDQPIQFGGDSSDSSDSDSDDYDIEFVGLTTQPKERPADLEGYTYRIRPNPTGPSLYVTINDFEEEPYEIFFKTNNAEHQELLDMVSRTLTSLMRRGISAEHLIGEFKKYESPSGGGWYEQRYIKSRAAAIGMIMEKHYRKLGIVETTNQITENETTETSLMKGDICPACGESTLWHRGGCADCTSCTYSDCG